MSRIEQDPSLVNPPQSTDEPAVGLVAVAERGDETAGQILRAFRNGHDVFVTASPGEYERLDGIEFAQMLGATVVLPTEDSSFDPRKQLASVARNKGHPGLIFQEDVTTPIHFDRSRHALSEASEYVIEAASRSQIDPNPDVLVAIPTYNEAETISDVVRNARQYANAVLVVDDGSTDGTRAAAEHAGAVVVAHERNRGYGMALQTAFEEAADCGARRLVLLDGDSQHDPTDIPTFVAAHEKTEADLVVGCRFGETTETDLPRYRRVGVAVTNLLMNLSMGVVRSQSRIRDTQCGYRSFSRELIESLATANNIDSGMGASTDILHHAHINDFDIAEVETTIDYQVDGANSYNPLYHGIVLVMNLVETIEHERPITFLGIPGFISIFIGLGFGYWTISNYLQKGIFPSGLALATVLFTLAGILAAFAGIILHAINTHPELTEDRKRPR